MAGSDYYFKAVADKTMGDYFIVTSKTLFDKQGIWDDQEIPDSEFPAGFGEDGECIYSYNGPTAVGRKALLAAGFIENKKL